VPAPAAAAVLPRAADQADRPAPPADLPRAAHQADRPAPSADLPHAARPASTADNSGSARLPDSTDAAVSTETQPIDISTILAMP
jgi:hypothetical protein